MRKFFTLVSFFCFWANEFFSVATLSAGTGVAISYHFNAVTHLSVLTVATMQKLI
ncbi:MAG: hypothetical protein IPN46_14070 [Saprospiraceae bacterium]|nr:hypothetical protein [Saprospiraceae bacterium]